MVGTISEQERESIQNLSFKILCQQDKEIDIKNCECGGNAVLIGEIKNSKAEGGIETLNFASMESSVEKALLRKEASKLYYRCSVCGKTTPFIQEAPSICRVCSAPMKKIGQDYICDRCGYTEPRDPMELE
jgi:rubrerythrin